MYRSSRMSARSLLLPAAAPGGKSDRAGGKKTEPKESVLPVAPCEQWNLNLTCNAMGGERSVNYTANHPLVMRPLGCLLSPTTRCESWVMCSRQQLSIWHLPRHEPLKPALLPPILLQPVEQRMLIQPKHAELPIQRLAVCLAS